MRNSSRLIISIDGSNGEESDLKVRQQVIDVIQKAKLPTNTEVMEAEKHKGLYKGMRDALDYAFEKNDYLTILEEDCIPSSAVGDYLEFLHNTKLADGQHICLSRHVRTNFIPTSNRITITKYPFVWGWHASADVWEKSRGYVTNIAQEDFLSKLREFANWNIKIEKFWTTMLQSCKDIEIARKEKSLENLDLSVGLRRWAKNSWATPYTINYWLNSTKKGALRPPINMIQNIGFEKTATNTVLRPPHARDIDQKKLEDLKFDLKQIKKFDQLEDKLVFGVHW